MTINVENMTRLIARLRSPSVEGHFDMRKWLAGAPIPHKQLGEAIHDCGTTACIAGHAMVLAQPTQIYNGHAAGNASSVAREWLGLTLGKAAALFEPSQDLYVWERITPTIAADVCEHLLQTGEIVWPDEVCK